MTELIAVISTIIAVISFGFTVYSVRKQQEFNELSMRPHAQLEFLDYEHKIVVKLKNVGNGPLFIKELRVLDRETSEILGYSLIGVKNIARLWKNWSGFRENLPDCVIRSGEDICLISKEWRGDDINSISVSNERRRLRSELCALEIQIFYEDIFKKKMEPYKRKLDWFDRTL